MRLLNTKTLELIHFVGDPPEYAILSHRRRKEEILFEDASKVPLSNPENPARSKLGFSKVMGTCALAANDGFEWVWIDSCCIDKSSSAELQESINYMFRWYQQAEVCYAYLSDVVNESSGWSKDFEKSQWFSRGWTLQELLAPANVEFYSVDWSPIGTKLCRTDIIASITGIEIEALEFAWGSKEDRFCAAQKFSWAAHRKVSKPEDTAYCLFGLFNVNRPLLYGEGEEKAFLRLQKAIFKETADHTLLLFAWAPANVSMLGSWITRFCRRSDCLVCRSHLECFPSNILYSNVIRSALLWQLSVEDAHYIRMVQQGIMIELPLMKCILPGKRSDRFVAILPLCRRGHETFLFGIVFQQVSAVSYVRLLDKPVILDVDTLEIDRNRQGAYNVYNEATRLSLGRLFNPLSCQEPRLKLAEFEFFSPILKPIEWRCKSQYDALVEKHVRASFPLPELQNDRYLLTVSFQSVIGQDMVGNITLWYSMSNIGLYDIKFSQSERRFAQWAIGSMSQPQHCMRIDVPFSRTGLILRVILRRISILKHTSKRVFGPDLLKYDSLISKSHLIDVSSTQTLVGYRLYVNLVPKVSQTSIPEAEPLGQSTKLRES